MRWGAAAWLSAAIVAGGCYTGLDDAVDPGAADAGTSGALPDGEGSADEDDGESDGDDDVADAHLAQIGLRRLSAYEYDQSVAYLLGAVARGSAEVLPAEHPDPEEDYAFESHYEAEIVSSALLSAAETLAQENIDALLSDPARRDAVVGCTPSGPDDAGCMATFVEAFGRRAFRRPLTDDEVARYLELQECSADVGERCGFAVDADDFYEGVAAVIGSMLVSPRFLFRVEVGRPVDERPGAFRLDAFEVAARLSFLLWGTTPDDPLLDAATAGELEDTEDVRARAEAMLDDPRARSHIARFHAVWLGYLDIPHEPALADRMRRESDALVERVVFDERRPWRDLFALGETFVDDTLAEHYGLPTPNSAEPVWVSLPADSGRAGILSQGAFLSVGITGDDDTRPIVRGKRLSTILMCQPIPPPPANVPFEEPPPGAVCKSEVLAAHSQGSCAGCHQYMDGLGFGLERFDGLGRYRETEPVSTECEIEGAGTFPPGDGFPQTAFSGPAELSSLLTESVRIQACAATQLLRYTVGRTIRRQGVKQAIHEEDVPLVDALIEQLGAGGRFDELILEMVSSPFFLHRVEY